MSRDIHPKCDVESFIKQGKKSGTGGWSKREVMCRCLTDPGNSTKYKDIKTKLEN